MLSLSNSHSVPPGVLQLNVCTKMCMDKEKSETEREIENERASKRSRATRKSDTNKQKEAMGL